MKSARFLTAVFLFSAFGLLFSVRAQDTVRVSCTGNSITMGARLQESKWGGVDSSKYRYSALLNGMLRTTYLTGAIPVVKDSVRNFGLGGRCVTKKGTYTYWGSTDPSNPGFPDIFTSKPTLVTIMLGTNDTKPRNWTVTDTSFEKDYGALIDTFAQHITTHPKILCAFPPANFCHYPDSTNKQNDSVTVNFLMPIIRRVTAAKGVPLIDTHTPFLDKRTTFPDSTHPDTNGHKMLADIFYEGIINNNLASTNQAFKIRFLYYGKAPGVVGNLSDTLGKPMLYFYPAADTSTLAPAVLVCPGDRYTSIAIDKEGKQVAAWLNSKGISAFVLRYRYGTYTYPVPVNDVQRAMRLIRFDAAQYKIDTTKIGIAGFSAGGHLASALGTHFDNGNASSLDPVEKVKCRPDFMLLIYPVITMTGASADTVSRNALFGASPSAGLLDTFSNQKWVTQQTPPAFIAYDHGDPSVPVQNSIIFDSALSAHGCGHKLVMDTATRHGFGLDGIWPDSAVAWMQTQKILPTSTESRNFLTPAALSNAMSIAIVKRGTVALSIKIPAPYTVTIYSSQGKRLASYSATGMRTWVWHRPAPGIYIAHLKSRGVGFTKVLNIAK